MHKQSIHGFDAFSKGTFGNSGQNLYVSAKGVLQRIFQFDVNKDGYVDLCIANSHDYNEHPNLHIISDPLGEAKLQEVLTQGSQAGLVADLNGNGFDDLVIASCHDGHHSDLPSYVFFGGEDGITENRKIDLAAPGCVCCAAGDFNGDGKTELCYLIANSPDCSTPDNLFDRKLRVYFQGELGFSIADYVDYPTTVSWFTAADIDGDGIDDLYCRTPDGRWLILWGGKDGFSMERCSEVSEPTDDTARFELLPFGGGNVRYSEFARPKVVEVNGTQYLFYADKSCVKLIHYKGRCPTENVIQIPVPNVISIASGHIAGEDLTDLVLLQINSLSEQSALVYYGTDGYQICGKTLPVCTPRDALLCDFAGNGHDDLVVIQGRNDHAFTTESLLFPTDENGVISDIPRRFVTHNCVQAFAADFNKSGKKSIVFVNQQESSAYGHIPVYVYLGSEKGFSPENRLEFPGHSAGIILSADFNDNGWPDILVCQNGEDQPHLQPDNDIYLGGPDGFSLDKKVTVKAPLAWGCQCADLNKDGYLDLIMCCGNKIWVVYGGPDGFQEENSQVLDPVWDMPEGTSAGALWPALADLNGNGWLDFIVPLSWCPYSLIYWGGPDGYSNQRVTKLPVECALEVRVADLNKNGYPDLVFGTRVSNHTNVYHEGTVTIFWGGEDGYSGYNCCVLPSYQSNGITIADFNNDGWLDIFASSYFNKKERDINSYIYWNDHGSFSLTNRKRFFAHSSSAAWACDFNEDGYVDILVSHHRAYGSHRTESALWWNGPDGFSEDRRSWLPSLGPHGMVPTDAGNLMDRSPEEIYITPVMEADKLSSIGWDAELPQKTWVNCQIRSASSIEALSQAEFIGNDGSNQTRFTCDEPIPADLVCGQYFQVKLFIGAVNAGSTPRITEIYAD